MNKKNQIGFTLITLVITIIVTIILTTTIVVTSDGIINETRKKEFAKELYTISLKVNEYEFRTGNLPIKKNNVTLNLEDIENREQFSNETTYDSGIVVLKELDLYEADIESVKRGNKKDSKDVYLISESTKNIYYLKGVVIDNIYYYTLTDELRNELNV